MVDYRKFDHIDTDDSEDEPGAGGRIQGTGIAHPKSIGASSEEAPGSVTRTSQMTKKGKENRLKFEYNGQTVYEWEQSLEEVNIYIEPPPGVTRAMLDVKISHMHLTVGLKGAPPFIDEDIGGPVKHDESLWTFVDGELNINLQKMNKAEAWDCALKGRSGSEIDPHTKEEVKKKLMLERFQEEHPGFDFSGADFNGSIPDARTFMGGVKY